MQKIKAIFTLIRIPNLVFIVLTQIICWHFIVRPYLQENSLTIALKDGMILWLSISTGFIAAAGYMINDYFDMGIDSVNKPERVTIETVFKRRAVIFWHILLNIVALSIVVWIIFGRIPLRMIGIQIVSIFLLLVYSTTFKRKLISGNVMISLLTSLSLITVAMFEPAFPLTLFANHAATLFWFYIFFAFLITFSREIVKDIEDIKGDQVQHCRTIPLVWGIQVAKQFVYSLIGLLILLLAVASGRHFYLHQLTQGICMILLIVPLFFILRQMHLANHSNQFHQISSFLKWTTLAGILSMLLN